MENLQGYLDELRGEGKSDSEGAFTLDFLYRAQKLSSHQKLAPATFLIKALQAAVTAGASSLRCRLSRRAVTVRFRPAGSTSSDLLSHEMARERWVEHLRVALLAAVALNPRRVEIWWTGSGDQCHWSLGEPPPVNPGPLSYGEVVLAVSLSDSSWWRQLLPNPLMAELQVTLVERCALAPIPVFVDERMVNEPYPERLPLVRGGPLRVSSRPTLWLVEHVWLALQGFCLAPPVCRLCPYLLVGLDRQGVKPVPGWAEATMVQWLDGVLPPYLKAQEAGPLLVDRPRGPDGTEHVFLGADVQLGRDGAGTTEVHYLHDAAPLLWPDITLASSVVPGLRFPGLRVGRWMALDRQEGSNRSRLIYLKDGVLLNPIEVETTYPGTIALIDCPDIVTDLSHLEVVRNEQVEQDVLWMLREEQLLALRLKDVMGEPGAGGRLQIPSLEMDYWRSVLDGGGKPGATTNPP